MHETFWLETVNGRDLLEDVGINGRTVLKGILKTWFGGVT